MNLSVSDSQQMPHLLVKPSGKAYPKGFGWAPGAPVASPAILPVAPTPTIVPFASNPPVTLPPKPVFQFKPETIQQQIPLLGQPPSLEPSKRIVIKPKRFQTQVSTPIPAPPGPGATRSLFDNVVSERPLFQWSEVTPPHPSSTPTPVPVSTYEEPMVLDQSQELYPTQTSPRESESIQPELPQQNFVDKPIQIEGEETDFRVIDLGAYYKLHIDEVHALHPNNRSTSVQDP